MDSKQIFKLLLLVFLSGLSACGYQFQGSGSALPKDVTKVYIAPIENNTTESSLTQLLQDSLTDEFERYGVLEVVDNYSDADAVLKTQVLDVKHDQLSSTSNTDTSLQLDTSIRVAAEIVELSTSKRLWSNAGMVLTDSFGTQSSAIVSTSVDFAASGLNSSNLAGLNSRELARGQESNAFQRLSDKTAKKIYLEAVTPEF